MEARHLLTSSAVMQQHFHSFVIVFLAIAGCVAPILTLSELRCSPEGNIQLLNAPLYHQLVASCLSFSDVNKVHLVVRDFSLKMAKQQLNRGD